MPMPASAVVSINGVAATSGRAFWRTGVARWSLDREYMRGLIFEHPKAKKELEALVHPLVRKNVLHYYKRQSKVLQRIVHCRCSTSSREVSTLVSSSICRAVSREIKL